VQKLNVDKAADTRDSLARALFDRVFIHIINRMNENNAAEKGSVTSIGLLDIFGFEIFKDNSFEQLCINYCNEMLQNHFNFVIFTAEKQLYAEENITCDTIEFRDNAAVINDIQAAFLGLDEEAKIPKGNSKTWFDKLVKSCPAGVSVGRGGAGGGGGAGANGAKKYTKFSIPSHKNSFVVSHYAGEVSYLPAMFLEKNTERLSESLLELMSQSSSKVMRALFVRQEEKESGKAQKVTRSISWSFTNQLNSLMTMLRQSDSHFIRCIKSNDACRPMIFDAELVQKQLLYSGVFEVIKIQQSGLPFRLPHVDFMKRYSCLFPVKLRWTHGDIKAFVKGMKEQLKLDLPTIQIGKTRVFYKGHEHRGFEIAREALLQANARILQRWLMHSTCRSVYKGMLKVREAFKTALSDVDVAKARGAFDQVADCTYSVLCSSLLPSFPFLVCHVSLSLSLSSSLGLLLPVCILWHHMARANHHPLPPSLPQSSINAYITLQVHTAWLPWPATLTACGTCGRRQTRP
jgi:myosin heavy subunit